MKKINKTRDIQKYFRTDIEKYEIIKKNEGFGQSHDNVEELRERRIFDTDLNENPDQVLDTIRREIDQRIKITQREIFYIGEALIQAKKICVVQGNGFRNWIETNFDFSYETAVNFMQVYKACLGYINIAVEIPVSVLYKLSAPSFPDELRDIIFKKGLYDSLNNKKLKEMSERYKSEGIEGINEEYISSVSKRSEIMQDIKFFSDQYENTTRYISQLKNSFDGNIVGFPERTDKDKEIIAAFTPLYNTLGDIIEQLDQAMSEAEQKLDEYLTSVNVTEM